MWFQMLIKDDTNLFHEETVKFVKPFDLHMSGELDELVTLRRIFLPYQHASKDQMVIVS